MKNENDVLCDSVEVGGYKYDELLYIEGVEDVDCNLELDIEDELNEDGFYVSLSPRFNYVCEGNGIASLSKTFKLYYSMEKYMEYGKKVIMINAINEIREDCLETLYYAIMVFFHKKINDYNKVMN